MRRPVRHGVPPAIKSLAYLPLVLADLEVQERAPGAWSLALDEDGNLNEGLGSNVFLGVGGRLLTPRAETVLPGLTRATVIDLARELGIAVDERDMPPAIAATAEEAFVTSTSLCILPARSFDGRPLPGGAPGPVDGTPDRGIPPAARRLRLPRTVPAASRLTERSYLRACHIDLPNAGSEPAAVNTTTRLRGTPLPNPPPQGGRERFGSMSVHNGEVRQTEIQWYATRDRRAELPPPLRGRVGEGG